MRFIYTNLAVERILSKVTEKRSGLDFKPFIYSCQSYDGGFSWLPYGESHAGLSYCAVASLVMSGDTPGDIDRIVQRQVGGFCGRIHKYPDTCYSFWNMA